MIAFIRGVLVKVRENTAVVESGGIGYCVYITARDAQSLEKPGSKVLFYTYLNVREDAMQLFGFLSEDDLQVFRMLLNVSGIGPKAAQGILSAITPNDLRFAVLADDIKTISAAPGIGKKTAQKLVLELKDKFNLQEAFEEKLLSAVQTATSAGNENMDEAVQALVALGYGGGDALRAVRAASAEADVSSTEDLLKAALKRM